MSLEVNKNNIKQKKIIDHLKKTGMDIIEPFPIGWYNEIVTMENQLPSFSNDQDLGVLLGNTKNFWPLFLKYLEENPKTFELENPFDHFVEILLEDSLNQLDIESKIKYGHIQDPEFLKIQKLASLIGLAYFSETRLSIHPQFGPWFSLRAVVVFPLSYTGKEAHEAKNPCNDCESRCLLVMNKKKENWKDWLAVRDSCPLGREYRFNEDQIEYHYTKNKLALKKTLKTV